MADPEPSQMTVHGPTTFSRTSSTVIIDSQISGQTPLIQVSQFKLNK